MSKPHSSRFALALARAVALACACQPALAQDELAETVVTATRTPVKLDALDAPVIVITRQDIERSMASDVSELLQQQAGLEIARNGGPGQTTSLFMRGTESNHTVVLIDGVRVNPGTIGGAALQNIAPESLERIEIVKGPRSALYGTDAIGGVVQLFTRGVAKSGFTAGATYGSLDTQQLSGDGAFSVGDAFRFGLGGSYAQSDGMPTFVDDDMDRGWRNVTGRLTAEYDASESLTLRARAFDATGRTEYTEQTFSDPPYAPVSQDFANSVYSFEGDYRSSGGEADGLALRATVSRMRDEIDQNQVNFTNTADFAHTRRDTVDLQLDLARIHAHSVSIGAQYSDENTEALSFGAGFDENTTVLQGFVQDQFAVGKLTSRLALGFVDHETFGSEVTWNAEFGLAFGSGTRLALAGGKAFRAPDSTDRFGFGGNPDLDPEVSEQYELSLRQKIGQRHQLSIAAFDNRIHDLISYVITDPDTFDGQNQNIDRARIQGVELGYQFTGDAWRASAELTLQDPRDEITDQRLLRRSREALVLAVDRDVGALDLGLDVAAYGDREDFGFPENVILDSYALVNATVRYRVNGGLTLQGRIENAFDEDYTLAQGYRTEGRAYTIGVRYSFD
ncbi:MAG TPA: TonB-dependent receptor [Steroidobacteraceae bacterium]|nr:TonB-dependent receptor [Steroidobacteraceae bacterium]